MKNKPNHRFKKLKSVADIVDTMVQGLENEWIHVDMDTFGTKRRYNGRNTCFGCAATSTLCQLMDEKFKVDNIQGIINRAKQFNYDISEDDLSDFENAIDSLRKGYITYFFAEIRAIKHLFSFKISKKQLPYYGTLPYLSNTNCKTELIHYKNFANLLRQKGI